MNLRELLPDWAVQTENLDYGVPFDEPGLYYTLHPDGELCAVGIVQLSNPPSWHEDWGEKMVMCRAYLSIRPDKTSGYSRGVTTGVTYETDGTLRIANGRSEQDILEKADVSFEEWAKGDIEAKIRYMKLLLFD